jgi:hypothetical protein
MDFIMLAVRCWEAQSSFDGLSLSSRSARSEPSICRARSLQLLLALKVTVLMLSSLYQLEMKMARYWSGLSSVPTLARSQYGPHDLLLCP